MEMDGGLFVDESYYHHCKAVHLFIYLCVSECDVCHSLTSKNYIFEYKTKPFFLHARSACKGIETYYNLCHIKTMSLFFCQHYY